MEQDLLRRARSGDRSAFDQLVALHGSLVLTVARSITRHRQDAEDVAQECFLRLFQSLDRLDETRPLEPWLVTVTLNLARNRVARRPERTESELAETGFWASPQDDLMKQADQVALRKLLHEAVESLPTRMREAFVLRDVLELDVQWVAEALGITGVTVRRLSTEARSRIAQWIEKHRRGEEGTG